MRVRFEGHGSLRLIPEIPDIPIARLEGRNGIGKSLAARLLELITGEPPYVGLPLAWASLVEQLGPVQVTLDDVAGHTIVINLDSQDWGAGQVAAVANPGQATLDGVETDWATLRSILQVRRVAGDETLAETIGLALSQTAKEVDAQRLEVSERSTAWANKWDQLRINSDDPARAGRSLLTKLADLSAERTRLIRAKEEAAAEAQAAMNAAAGLETIARIEATKPSQARYAETWQRRAELADAIASDEAALMDLRGTQTTGSRDDFERLSKLVRIRRDAHTRAQFDETRVLRTLRLDGRPPKPRITQLLREARTELRELEQNLQTQFSAGTIKDVASAMQRTLLGLPTELQREIVAELDQEVSVGELARGLERRRETLRDVPKSDATLDVERRMESVRSKVNWLEQLPEVMRATDRKLANLQEAESELEAFFDTSESERTARSALTKQLSDKREQFVQATSDALLALLTVRAAAGLESLPNNAEEMLRDESRAESDALAGSDESDRRLVPPDALDREVLAAVSQIVEQVKALGVVELESTHAEAIFELRSQATRVAQERALLQKQIDQTLQASESAQEDALADLRLLRLELAELLEALSNDPEWEPLRAVASDWYEKRGGLVSEISSLVPDLRERSNLAELLPGEANALDLSSKLRALVDSLEEAASTVRDRWDLASAFIHRESHDLSPRLLGRDARTWQFSQLNDSELGAVLTNWVESEVSSLLSQDILRRELFESASEVEYDLEARSVVWRSEDGRRRRRPLEAFSSGEQVFAYTRAKLESLRTLSHQAEFVLIFLDEFGAFVARDRFGQLMRYVQTDVLGVIAHQVVVMLPSSESESEFEIRKAHAAYANENYLVEDMMRQGRAR